MQALASISAESFTFCGAFAGYSSHLQSNANYACFRVADNAPRRHHETMATTPLSPPSGSMPLRMRRVLYQAGLTDWGEGVVTEHDPNSGMVTVLDTDHGTFWRGHEELLQIVA
ncbi:MULTISPECIES: hypothetical protein [Paraburkholderia]|uniref:hypothetical protein n=1 Tax=Paraburkholderia TaxID=1822464 RepID=UPI002AAFFA9F|nr:MULTISPECIES: hypothetical protein [Paraburkholderia]